MGAINYLIDEIGVELDVPNENDHTALTFCAELGLTDLAIKLLSKGANPNHRISGGGTALCFAIQNDDVRLVSALLEFTADYTFFVVSWPSDLHHAHVRSASAIHSVSDWLRKSRRTLRVE